MFEMHDVHQLSWLGKVAANRKIADSRSMAFELLRLQSSKTKVTRNLAWAVYNALATFVVTRGQFIISHGRDEGHMILIALVARGDQRCLQALTPFLVCALRTAGLESQIGQQTFDWATAAARVICKSENYNYLDATQLKK